MKVLHVPADRTADHGGACNLGDAWLTDAMAGAMRSRGVDVESFDFGSVDRATSDGKRVRGSRSTGLWAAIGRADAVVLGGGTLLQADQPDRLDGGLPRLCAVVAGMAGARRRPAWFFSVGCDTIEARFPRGLIGLATRRAEVWLREEQSKTRFELQFPGRSGRLGADAALLDETTFRTPRERVAGPVVVALNASEARGLRIDDVERLATLPGPLRFLAMDQQPRVGDFDALPMDMRTAVGASPEVLGWADAAEIVQGASVVVASRMHALYMAAMAGVPCVAVGDREKVRAFCDEFGVPRVDNLGEIHRELPRPARPDAVEGARKRANLSMDELVASLRQVLSA